VEIGSVPNPQSWGRWSEAEAFLEPARELGGFEAVIEPDEALWAVMDGDQLLGCATAWLGGRDYRRWIAKLDEAIGAAARGAGATRLTAYGRGGWRRALKPLGWVSLGELDGMTVYRREL
jgi:hypothetical protein